MKTILHLFILSALMTAIHQNARSQSVLPLPSILSHYQIAVSLHSTTVLIFPASVKPVDRGTRDILAQKQPGVENVLKLKAARKNFPLTNLHVFTSDGQIYAFDVRYTDSLAQTVDFIQRQIAPGSGPKVAESLLSDQPLNDALMGGYVRLLKGQKSDHHAPINRFAQMSIRLEKVALAGPLLFFRYRITNSSQLDYPLDFIRLYIRDRQKAARTSVQDKELQAAYADTVSYISGRSHVSYVVAVPAFTLAGGKELITEVYEKNGGRSLLLQVQNKTLLKAKKL